MTKENIEKAAKEAVQNHFQCNGKYPCEERDHCEFCNGHNSAFDCKEDCGADDFNEGFFAGAQWCINAVWHDVNETPEDGRVIVLLGKYGTILIYGPNMRYYKEAVIADGGFLKWAYKEDLMPTNMEE